MIAVSLYIQLHFLFLFLLNLYFFAFNILLVIIILLKSRLTCLYALNQVKTLYLINPDTKISSFFLSPYKDSIISSVGFHLLNRVLTFQPIQSQLSQVTSILVVLKFWQQYQYINISSTLQLFNLSFIFYNINYSIHFTL